MYSVPLGHFVRLPINGIRTFSKMFLGNEFQKNLKTLYLHVHPDVMAGFPDSVKIANKNSLQVDFIGFLQCRY